MSKPSEKRNNWPVAYRWAAMGTLVIYTAVGTKTVSVAWAQQAPAPGAAASMTARRYAIKAGPLGEVLPEWERAAGLTVKPEKEGILNVQSPGITGLYSAEQALQAALAGTGVRYRFAPDAKVILELAGVSSSVDVVDRAPLANPKYTEPLKDTPQTISVIPRSVIEQQGATTLRDVLRNVPGLTLTAGEGGTPAGDNLTLRGFSARNDLFVDGVRDLSPQARDPFNMEQVEVVKGPTSAFSGRGSAGGTVNMVSKAPGLNRMFSGSLNFGTDETKRVTADMNVPLTGIGLRRSAFRLNLLAHESGVAGRDVVENSRWGVAPSLAFGLATVNRLTLGYYKVKQDNISDYGIPWVPATNNALAAYRDKPAPVPRNTFYGFKDRDHEYLGADFATVKYEHDFAEGTTLRNQLRYGRSTRNSIATPPRFASNDSTAINRELRAWGTTDEVWDNQTDFVGRFNIGKHIGHTVSAAVSYTHENNIRRALTAPISPTALLNPNPNDVYPGVLTLNPNIGDVTGNTVGTSIADTVKFGEKWMVNGSLRWERFAVDGVSTTPAPVVRTDKMLSGRAGVVYRASRAGNFYASWGSSLSPSLEGLSYGTANTAIDPEKTYTTEAGTKWDLFGGRVLATGALFRVNKDNARTPGINPGDPPQVLSGKQRVQGVELGLSGNITRNLNVFGAYTMLDSKIVSSNTPAERGQRIQNAPRNSFNMWSTLRHKRLTVGGGPRFVGKRFGNNIGTRWVPNYWTLEAMASYNVSQNLDLRLNLNNLNDAYYFDRLGGGHVVPGPARSAMFGAAFRF